MWNVFSAAAAVPHDPRNESTYRFDLLNRATPRHTEQLPVALFHVTLLEISNAASTPTNPVTRSRGPNLAGTPMTRALITPNPLLPTDRTERCRPAI